MPRRVKREKPYIIVFCEGESEKAYADFLKREFRDVAVIQRPKSTGTFDESGRRFRNDHKYLNNAEVTDEIWFFFDVETVDIPKWSGRLRIISRLRKLRKKHGIRIRLLMTTGVLNTGSCYTMSIWHRLSAQLRTKERMLSRVVTKEPTYKKGDMDAISRIAENYPTAVVNNLLLQGLPGLDNTDKRNEWLCTQCLTFSAVYEAIEFLESLKS